MTGQRAGGVRTSGRAAPRQLLPVFLSLSQHWRFGGAAGEGAFVCARRSGHGSSGIWPGVPALVSDGGLFPSLGTPYFNYSRFRGGALVCISSPR